MLTPARRAAPWTKSWRWRENVSRRPRRAKRRSEPEVREEPGADSSASPRLGAAFSAAIRARVQQPGFRIAHDGAYASRGRRVLRPRFDLMAHVLQRFSQTF